MQITYHNKEIIIQSPRYTIFLNSDLIRKGFYNRLLVHPITPPCFEKCEKVDIQLT